MRWLLSVLLLLLGAVGVAVLLHRYPGVVTIEVGPWIIETSAAVAVVGMVVLFLVLYLLLRLLGLLAWGPRALRRGLTGRRSEKGRRSLVRGLIEMAEGRWETAEKLLVRHAEGNETSLLNYLAAARAAQQVGAYERRDRYLRTAIEENPEADIAVSLTQAELQLAHHQTEHALATLTRLHSLQPGHTYVMKLLSRLYAELEDWDRLAELLPDMRRRRVVSAERLRELELRTALGRLRAAPARGQELMNIWESLPRGVRDDAAVLRAFVRRLTEAGAMDRAEKRLRQYLNRHWDEDLVRDYGLIEATDSNRQLDHAERWASGRGRSPMLLLTLGRLCARNRLWGKARAYLESSMGIEPRAETCRELAELLEHLGETGAAREHYRRGLELAVHELASDDPWGPMLTETERAAGSEMPVPVEAR